MELFEDGGEVDPVSGNDIPLGSTAKEVRDDQPAMLSEGEMVIPADVVRYFGVEHIMNMRDQAKIGYKKMEAMGQFGTDEGQTLPDETLFNAGGPPFTIEDIEIIEDEMEDKDEAEDKIEAKSGALVKKYAEGGGTRKDPVQREAIGTPLLPDPGRKPELRDPQGLGQLIGSTGIGEFKTKFYMDKTGQIHQVFAMDGLPSAGVQEDWIEIDSPFELRSYRELGGGATTTTAPASLARTQYTDPGGPNPNDPVGSGFNKSFNSLSEWGRAVGIEIADVLNSFNPAAKVDERGFNVNMGGDGGYGGKSGKGGDVDPGGMTGAGAVGAGGPGSGKGGDVDPGGMTGGGEGGAGGGAGDTSDTGGSSTGASDTGADSSVSDDGSASPGDFSRGGSVRKYATGGTTDNLLLTSSENPEPGIITPFQAVEAAMQKELEPPVLEAMAQIPQDQLQTVSNYVNSNYEVTDQTAKNFGGSTMGRSPADGSIIDSNTVAAGMINPNSGQLTGSLAELARTVSDASVQNLQNFASLKDSLLGNAFLDIMGIVTNFAINPAPHVVGLVQGLASVMSPEISKGFQSLQGIPQKEAAAAGRIATTMSQTLQQMSDKEKAELGLYSAALGMGLDPANMPANQSVVSVQTSNGIQAGILNGAIDAPFAHVTLANGDIIGKDNIVAGLNKDNLGRIQESYNFAVGRNMESAIAPPPEVEAMTKSMGPNFGTDDTPDDETSLQSYDYSTEGSFDTNTNTNDGGFDVGDSMGGDAGGADGTSDSGGDAASDTGASGPDGGVGGPGDFRHGGFVHKRKGKKKKARRGLAGR